MNEKAEEIQKIIAELCMNAPSEDVKSCLRTYQYGKDLDRLKRDLNVFRKPILEDTLRYLNAPSQQDCLKPAVLHKLICRIQNLLPETCSICKKSYHVKRDEEILLECAICGQDVHKPCFLQQFGATDQDMDHESIMKLINPYNIKNLFYICDPCIDNTIPHDESEKKKKEKNSEIQSNITQVDEQITISRAATSTIDKTDNSIPNTKKKDETSQDQNQKEENHNEDSNNENKNNRICRYYKQGTCKFGRKGAECPFTHPKACRKLLSHGNKGPRGCKEGQKCQDFHPRMCNTSITNGTCYNQNCVYVHVKGTKRYKTSNDFEQREYQNRRTNYELKINTQKKFKNEPQNLNFLEILGNFKKEIIEDFDLKLAKILSLNQHQPQPKPLMQIPTYPPTRPTYQQIRPFATQNYHSITPPHQTLFQQPIQPRQYPEEQFLPQHNMAFQNPIKQHK